MQSRPVQLSDVVYNPATQCFEALVTVHSDGRSRKYACAINAPISMSFKDAADGLARQALRREAGRGGTYSETQLRSAKQRAGRQRFDPRGWLESLISLPSSGDRAA